MSNQKKSKSPPILSYHGTAKGLLKAVWLPILAFVPVQGWYMLLFISIIGFPLLITWLTHRWFGYVVSHTKYQGAQLHFNSENSRLFPILFFSILLTSIMPIFIVRISLYIEEGYATLYSTLYALTITVIYALVISQILYFILDDLAKHLSKGNALATMRYHAKKGRLFAVVLGCLLLRLAILGAGSMMDEMWIAALLPLIADIVTAVGMMSDWGMPWRAGLASLVGMPLFMGVILCYAVGQLHLQGKPLRLQHWLIYQMAHWLMVWLGLVLVMLLIDSSWLGELSGAIRFRLWAALLLLISCVAMHTCYRLLVRQLRVSTKSDALSTKKGVDSQK